MITADQRQAGWRGGEGGQWPRALAVDSTGRSLLLGIDVGGIFRSRDGGSTWEPANVGYSPRGCVSLAFDPRNSRRAIAIGGNSSAMDEHGVYLTEDGAASWKSVFPLRTGGLEEFRIQVTYDPSSYDPVLKETRVVYYSRIREDKVSWGTVESHPALYESKDGGRSWRELRGVPQLGGSFLAPHPKGERLWAGGHDGLYLYNLDEGTLENRLRGEVTGLATVPSEPLSVWVSQAQGLFHSKNEGKTWRKLNIAPLIREKARLRHIAVSPADPRRILVWSDESPHGWDWKRWVSHDGGETWTEQKKVSSGAFLPDNTRQGLAVWHPTNPEIAWGLGGDWPTRSTDGGKSFRYSGQGVNNIFIGNSMSFSLSDPNLLFFGSQDYNGAFTANGGAAWNYTPISGEGWGGFCYGGYALNRDVFVVGEAPSWGGARRIKISRDGGKTWQDTGQVNTGLDFSYGAPGDKNVLFIGNHRSPDQGKTWTVMTDCDAVVTHGGAALYGIKRGTPWKVVQSADNGLTWTTVGETSDDIFDLAWDPSQARIIAAVGLEARALKNGAWERLNIPRDQYRQTRVRSVAVDPSDPRVVYVGSAGNVYSVNNAVLRSGDGGKTWQNLTRQTPLRSGEKDGGREAVMVRVHPRTRHLWVATGCYGFWAWIQDGA